VDDPALRASPRRNRETRRRGSRAPSDRTRACGTRPRNGQASRRTFGDRSDRRDSASPRGRCEAAPTPPGRSRARDVAGAGASQSPRSPLPAPHVSHARRAHVVTSRNSCRADSHTAAACLPWVATLLSNPLRRAVVPERAQPTPATTPHRPRGPGREDGSPRLESRMATAAPTPSPAEGADL